MIQVFLKEEYFEKIASVEKLIYSNLQQNVNFITQSLSFKLSVDVTRLVGRYIANKTNFQSHIIPVMLMLSSIFCS